RSPESRTCSNRSRKGPTCPPGLCRMRTSPRAGATANAHVMAASRIALRMAVRFMSISLSRFTAAEYQLRKKRQGSFTCEMNNLSAGRQLSAASHAAQRRQANAGRIKATIDGENLPGDVACAIAAEKKYRFRQLFLQAVPVEGDRAVIVGADFRAMDGLCHRRVDRAGCHAIDAYAERSQFDRELFGQMGKPGLAVAVGRTQGGGAHR